MLTLAGTKEREQTTANVILEGVLFIIHIERLLLYFL